MPPEGTEQSHILLLEVYTIYVNLLYIEDIFLTAKTCVTDGKPHLLKLVFLHQLLISNRMAFFCPVGWGRAGHTYTAPPC